MNENLKEVRSINKNIRSSVRKLNPILKSLVGKKVEIAIRNDNPRIWTAERDKEMWNLLQ